MPDNDLFDLMQEIVEVETDDGVIDQYITNQYVDVRKQVRLKYERERANFEIGKAIQEMEDDLASYRSRIFMALGWNFILLGYFLQITHMLGGW